MDKRLTYSEGASLFYVSSEVLDQITPREVGWLSVASSADYEAALRLYREPGPFPFSSGSSRFECGTWNTAGSLGLGAAVRYLLEVGIEPIADRILELTDRLVAGLGQRGATIFWPRRAGEAPAAHDFRSGMVSFRLPGQDSAAIVQKLEANRILRAVNGPGPLLTPLLQQ